MGWRALMPSLKDISQFMVECAVLSVRWDAGSLAPALFPLPLPLLLLACPFSVATRHRETMAGLAFHGSLAAGRRSFSFLVCERESQEAETTDDGWLCCRCRAINVIAVWTTSSIVAARSGVLATAGHQIVLNLQSMNAIGMSSFTTVATAVTAGNREVGGLKSAVDIADRLTAYAVKISVLMGVATVALKVTDRPRLGGDTCCPTRPCLAAPAAAAAEGPLSRPCAASPAAASAGVLTWLRFPCLRVRARSSGSSRARRRSGRPSSPPTCPCVP